MSEKNALTFSIGILAAIAVWLTAYLVTVPIWVVFIAWASFAVVGGRLGGFVKSVASNFTGVLLAAVCLVVVQLAQGNSWMTGVVVGLGSSLMAVASRIRLLSVVPAIVWGFASMVGTVAVTARAITYTTTIGNPVLIVVTAMLLGACFGLCAQYLTLVLTSGKAPTGVGA